MADILTKEYDSNWVVLNSTYGIRYRKIGKIVFVKCKYDGSIALDTRLGTMPDGYRPFEQVRVRNYGEDYSAITINPDGAIIKLGTGTGWINCIASYPV